MEDRKPPHRLRRLDAIFSRNPVFFVTLCTAQRRHLLANESVHQLFITFCEASPEKASVWVGRYVLMPDHIHVFLTTEGSPQLSHWIGSLKKFLAAHWRKSGQAAPFWQEGFFDHLLRNGESYDDKWLYVQQNPVRAGLAQSPDDWPYAGAIHRLNWDPL